MNFEEQKRTFRGVWIPKEVWLDENLTALDKFIYAEIDVLDNEDGCTAGNEYFANFCQCSETKVSKSISKLESLGYVRRESFDGRMRVLHNCLVFCKEQPCKKDKSALQKMQGANYDNIYDNNINNNINNNIKKKNKQKKKIVVSEFSELLDELFAKTYEIYPRKIARERARKVWYSKFNDCVDEEQITERARKICKMVLACKAKWDDQNRDEEFMPYFSTWLNDSIEIK